MQDTVMQAPLQPFMKLVQSNMALLTQFTTSPEAMTHAQSLLQAGQASSAHLAQSDAFAKLMQGMLKNYTEFMAELGQSGMALLAQGQAAMLQTTQEASQNLVDEAQGRGRRSRQS